MRKLKKYGSIFRIRFSAGIQYRAAALGGIATQYAWGFLNILLYQALYRGDPAAFPMTLRAVVSYMWLRQGFLTLFETWSVENDIFSAITGGNVAYELTRPIGLYSMWYVRVFSAKLSRMLLRAIPLFTVAFLLPSPYGLTLPPDLSSFFGFLLTVTLGALVTCAYMMLIYVLTLVTLQPQGVRMAFGSFTEILSGALIPLPFFPAALRRVLEWSPFGAMQNVPFRVWSGDIAGSAVLTSAGLQLFWLIALVLLGQALLARALRRTAIQGG